MANRKYSDGLAKSTCSADVDSSLGAKCKVLSIDKGDVKSLPEAEFEVFLSFRGPDTRLNFADCLYYAMDGAGIRVFRDNEEIRKGEIIGGELKRAIKNSTICIPIFSRNYASSAWCLRELEYMVDCMRNKGDKRMIMPIFFDVDPNDIKLKTELYHDALQKHEEKFSCDVVQRWKEALGEVARIKGWDVKGKSQGELIRLIVAEVLINLNGKAKNLPNHLVGIQDGVEEVMRLLDEGSPDVRYLVIHGMGGIGKTTLAKVVFNQISSRFDGCSFLLDVREASKGGKVVQLQKQLLSEILKFKSMEISDYDGGINQIQRRFRNKKVLIVLDDLTKQDQLSKLAEKRDWFGQGSRIIITTRDTNFLPIKEDKQDNNFQMHFEEFKIYQMRELCHCHALELFSKHAFKMDSPPLDYDHISQDIVRKAGGLPLALEVIGSSLCGKNKPLWKDTLKKLDVVPNQDVLHKLKISFEMLEDAQREIFLDIASYFIGEEKIYPHYIWKALEFFPKIEIIVLTRMSLIKVDGHDRLLMHDLLKDLGREIVRQEDLKVPGKRSRLWSPKIALDIVRNRKGTDNIIALKLIGLPKEHDFTSEEFSRLPNLRLLELEGGNLVGDFKDLLSSLKWLSWHRCPSDLQVVNLHLGNLVVLKLLDSDIPENWNGWGPCLANHDLKVIHLMRCHLSTTPDFSTCLNLKILVFYEHCPKSPQICSSIRKLERLKRLEIIAARVPLSKMSASLNFDLFVVPSAIFGLNNLSSLKLEGQCIQELHPSIGEMAGLKCLSLMDCHQLGKLPDSIGKLRSLLILNLIDTKIRVLPDSIGDLKRLEKMYLGHTRIRELPNSIGNLKKLEHLILAERATRELSKTIGMLDNLKVLESDGCSKTKRIRESSKVEGWNLSIDMSWPPQLSVLRIPCGDPRSLTWIPSDLCHVELRYVKSPIEQPFFSNLRYLSSLVLFRCWLREIQFEQLENLHYLCVDRCELLVTLSGLSNLGHLKELVATNCSCLIGIQDLGGAQALEILSIEECNSIEKLPDLSKLHKLRTLRLYHSESLQGLPNVPSACYPYVHGCPMLGEFGHDEIYGKCWICKN